MQFAFGPKCPGTNLTCLIKNKQIAGHVCGFGHGTLNVGLFILDYKSVIFSGDWR